MLVLASLFVAGCHGHPHEGDEHPHEGDDHPGGGHGHGDGVAIGITEWSDDGLELFAEHPPAVVGQEVPFLAHVTVLEDFSALEGARERGDLRTAGRRVPTQCQRPYARINEEIHGRDRSRL